MEGVSKESIVVEQCDEIEEKLAEKRKNDKIPTPHNNRYFNGKTYHVFNTNMLVWPWNNIYVFFFSYSCVAETLSIIVSKESNENAWYNTVGLLGLTSIPEIAM